MRIAAEPIRPSRTPAEACERFLDDLGDWIDGCVRRYSRAPATHVHDQATYTTAWTPWILARGSARVRAFLADTRDRIAARLRETDEWRHGYWRMRDVHHGTEHFELFLGTLSQIDRRDATTIEQLVDAIEHIGNWSPEVAPWFDWDSGLFRSTFVGSDGIRRPQAVINTPDHLRCVNLCLRGYEITSASRYLEVAVRHGGVWADAILADARLPLAVGESGPIYDLAAAAPQYDAAPARRRQPNLATLIVEPARRLRSAARAFVERGHIITLPPPSGLSEVDKAERVLASNGIVTFLQLWKQTSDQRFCRAAERLVEPLVTQLHDPDAGAVAQVLRRYREMTGDRRYDAAVLAAVDRLAPWSVSEVAIDATAPRYNRQPSGIGKRKDMLQWLEDGAPRRHSPVLLSLAAEIRGDSELATRAIDLARTYFAIATRTLPDGRDHGCGARSVGSIARGHGRDNDTGVVTGVLAPMLRSRWTKQPMCGICSNPGQTRPLAVLRGE